MKKINKLILPLCGISAGLAVAMPFALTSCNKTKTQDVALTDKGDGVYLSEKIGIEQDKVIYNFTGINSTKEYKIVTISMIADDGSIIQFAFTDQVSSFKVNNNKDIQFNKTINADGTMRLSSEKTIVPIGEGQSIQLVFNFGGGERRIAFKLSNE